MTVNQLYTRSEAAKLPFAEKEIREWTEPASVVGGPPDGSVLVLQEHGYPGQCRRLITETTLSAPGFARFPADPEIVTRRVFSGGDEDEDPEMRAYTLEQMRQRELPTDPPFFGGRIGGFILHRARVFLEGKPTLYLELVRKNAIPDLTSPDPISLQGLEGARKIDIAAVLSGLKLLRRIARQGRLPLEQTDWSGWREKAQAGEKLKRAHPELTWAQISRRLFVSEKTLQRYRRLAREVAHS